MVKKRTTSLSRRFDTKIMGNQPVLETWDGWDDYINISNWFNYFYKTEEMWAWVKPWAKKTERFTFRELNNLKRLVPVRRFGIIAKMATDGTVIDSDTIEEMIRALKTVPPPSKAVKVKVVKDIKPDVVGPSIHQRVVQKANSIIEILEERLDNPLKVFNVMELFTKSDLSPKHINIIMAYYSPIIDEYASIKKNVALKESYKSAPKKELKATIAFLDLIKTSAEKICLWKKVVKVKKSKPTSAGKLASKMKYCKIFEGLGIVSIAPHKIVGASGVLLYNTVKRSLTLLLSTDPDGLTIRGTSVYGWNNKSVKKTIRKPEEIMVKVKKLKTASSALKFLKKIKTKDQSVNGRTSEDVIILKVYK